LMCDTAEWPGVWLNRWAAGENLRLIAGCPDSCADRLGQCHLHSPQRPRAPVV